MFRRDTVECICEISDIEKLRDYMECAHRNGYQCKHTIEYAAGKPYYTVTVNLSRFEVEQLAFTALTDQMRDFHQRRLKERNSAIEDARREGYAQAVEDQTARKRAKD